MLVYDLQQERQVILVAHEEHGHEIHALGQAQGQIGAVLVGEGRRAQVAGGQVDAFVGAEHSVGHYLADHPVVTFGDDIHIHQAVGPQNAIAHVDVLKEILVAGRGGLAFHQHYTLGRFPSPLRPPGRPGGFWDRRGTQNVHMAAGLLGGLAQQGDGAVVGFVVPVG